MHGLAEWFVRVMRNPSFPAPAPKSPDAERSAPSQGVCVPPAAEVRGVGSLAPAPAGVAVGLVAAGSEVTLDAVGVTVCTGGGVATLQPDKSPAARAHVAAAATRVRRSM